MQEYKADKELEAEYLALENERTVITEKIQTEEAKLILRQELETYVNNVRLYENAVKDMLQAAKEFAAEVEREGITLERLKAMLAVRKEEVQLVKLNSEIALEKYRAAEVEVDILKAQLDVVRSNLKVVQANLDVQEANVKVAEAHVDLAMTEAERSTLAADVATILAEIETKKIAAIRYQSEVAELAVEGESGIGRFTAQSSIVAQQKADAATMEAMFKKIGNMVATLLAYDLAAEDLLMLEQVTVPLGVLATEQSLGTADAAADAAAKTTIALERLKPTRARVSGEASVTEAHAWMRALMAEAHAAVKQAEANQTINSTTRTAQVIVSKQTKELTETISG